MKEILAVFVALMATISVGLALTATPPDWLEKMGPNTTYTYGDYSTIRAITENGFTPQTLNSKLTFATNGIAADIDQTAATSIVGTPEGITRQLLGQKASASVAEAPGLKIDAENDGSATTLVMNIAKDQTALFSGKLVSAPIGILEQGVDAPFDGTGPDDKPDQNGQIGYDDWYGGQHNLSWLDLTGNPAKWTATFDDTASLKAKDANGEDVTLKQAVTDAKVTVTAQATSQSDVANVVEIIDPNCVGFGELWTLNPDGTTNLIGPGHINPDDWTGGSAQLTEAAAGMSSALTLTDSQLMVQGNVFDFRTMDGSFGLDGAFADAVLTPGSTINVDLDGDMDAWWE